MAVAAASLAQRAAACSSSASSSGRGASDALGGSHGARPRARANGVTTKLFVVSTSAPAATNCARTRGTKSVCADAALAGRCTHLAMHRSHQLRLPQVCVSCLGKGIAQAALLEGVAHRAVENQPARSHVCSSALRFRRFTGRARATWVLAIAAAPPRCSAQQSRRHGASRGEASP